jgi:hypothetical protein
MLTYYQIIIILLLTIIITHYDSPTPKYKQYNALNGYKHKSSELLFVKDGSDRWIVGLQVLNDPNFAEIHDALNELERIEYTPFSEEEL